VSFFLKLEEEHCFAVHLRLKVSSLPSRRQQSVLQRVHMNMKNVLVETTHEGFYHSYPLPFRRCHLVAQDRGERGRVLKGCAKCWQPSFEMCAVVC